MILAAHQPHYLPWLGYLDKLRRADKFLVVDTVQFERKNYQNRGRIPSPTPEGWTWLTVPVVQDSREELILDKAVSNERGWQRKHAKALELLYRGAPYFHLYGPALKDIITSPWTKLVDLDLAILKFILAAYEIKTPVTRTSEMEPIPGLKSDFVLNMCKTVGATVYLSGEGGCRDYLDIAAFRAGGVEVQWQGFKHPDYVRNGGSKVPNGVTSLDLLFHCGPKAKVVLAGGGVDGLFAGLASVPPLPALPPQAPPSSPDIRPTA